MGKLADNWKNLTVPFVNNGMPFAATGNTPFENEILHT